VSLVCGVVLAVLGLRFLFDALSSQIVLALPWRELPARPGIAPGLLGAAAGLGLVALGRRLARTREPSRG
jgi:hypothetical protein